VIVADDPPVDVTVTGGEEAGAFIGGSTTFH